MKPPKTCIGPSSLAAIFGYSKWCSRDTLKHNLLHGYTECHDPAQTQRINCGINNEKYALTYYAQRKKYNVLLNPPFKRALNGRLVGKCDGLVINKGVIVGGVEVKCHLDKDVLSTIPLYYLIQVVAYMYLYECEWWDIVSFSFASASASASASTSASTSSTPRKCKVMRVYWKDYVHTWNEFWLPEIENFIKSVWPDNS